MRTKTVRILNIVAGILLIAAGIYCLCNEDVAVLSAGLMLGIFMLAAGITEIVVFAGMSGVLIGSGWLPRDGVLTVIMSLFLLFNQWFTLLSLPFIFTVWLMFSGISRFVSAFDLHAHAQRSLHRLLIEPAGLPVQNQPAVHIERIVAVNRPVICVAQRRA